MKDMRNQLWKLSIALVVLTSLLVVVFILFVYKGIDFTVDTESNFECGVIDLNEKSHEELSVRKVYLAKKLGYPIDIESGKQLFNDLSCNACHSIDKIVVGPPIKGLFERIDSLPSDWLYHFLQNPDSLFLTGDSYLIKIRNQENLKCISNGFIQLNETEKQNLIGYLGMFE